jgi:outer membrane biosynthesis protein TonB
MQLTRSEENKNKVVSGIITAAVFALLLLFLILFKLITTNPAFPEVGGGGGQEIALGMLNVGNDNVDFNAMGAVTDVVTEKETPKEEILTDKEGEVVDIDETKPEIKNNTTVITPVKPKEVVKEKTAAEKLAEKFKNNSGKNGGGIGDNDTPGKNGDPNGDPTKNGNGGHGNGDGGGDGDGHGPGKGSGSGPGSKFSIDLKGRAVVIKPTFPKDNKEEGKVVVEITVDSDGNVIEANPNGRGTTTSSALLKAKAKQVALSTKFNIEGKFEEQRGTMTIVFSFD